VYLNDTRELARKLIIERGEDNLDALWITGKGEDKKEVTYGSIYDRVVAISVIFSELEGREIHIFPHSYRHSRAEVLLTRFRSSYHRP